MVDTEVLRNLTLKRFRRFMDYDVSLSLYGSLPRGSEPRGITSCFETHIIEY
jgi:hypothetical protein